MATKVRNVLKQEDKSLPARDIKKLKRKLNKWEVSLGVKPYLSNNHSLSQAEKVG